ncbi:hypothetical protein EB796_016016 [Bugula neritina]|uniref:Uncharacterized protein n=1 Tax=Bugula neritina TaxID=10212 RepID=A0A7J7JI26_BUGNE|nr:hypothetical protein EB796_016016 [Bugula neritina]
MHSQQPHVQSVPTTNVINIGPTYSQERLPSVFPVVGPSYPPMQMMYSGNSNQSATAAEYYAAPSQPLAQPATVPAQYSAPAVSAQQPYHHLPPSPPQYSVVVPPASQYYANSTTGYETLCHKSPQKAITKCGYSTFCVCTWSKPPELWTVGCTQPPPQHPSFLPFVVPYQGTYGLVNVNAAPSQDQQGRDLPQNDGNTLRYFFNVGIACTSYFRNIAANAMHNNRIFTT